MVVHYASRFMQRIGKKRTRLQFHHTNYVFFDAYKAKYVHTACFPCGNSPAYILVPQQVTHRTYNMLQHVIYLKVTNHAF